MVHESGAVKRRDIALWAATLIALAVLAGLGTWQMQRRDWKLGLVARIDQRAHGEPISLTLAKDLWQRNQDVEYYRVLLVGRFQHAHERHLYTIEQGQAGWRIITPLVAFSGDVVLVDRGFVPEPLKEAATRPAGQLEGVVELVGLARAPGKRGWFAPDNDPARNRWFWRDLPSLAAAHPLDHTGGATPFIVEAEADPVPGGWPRGGVTRLVIPNRHLEYALTWYGLAVTLIFVVIFFVRNPRRREAGPV